MDAIDTTFETLALELRNAAKTRIAIPPLSNKIGENDLQKAYQIQQINSNWRINTGRFVRGKKIGLTSFAVQQQLGVDQPDYGVLFDDMEVLNGQSLSRSVLIQPKIEGEIAFILSEDLDHTNLSIIDVIECIDFALPALEIVDSRITDWNISITDTIADNASASHYVLGHTPKTLDEIDVVGCSMEISKNGEVVSKGKGSACLGSPLNALLWLANKMIELEMPLQAGEVILSGALGPMVDLNVGDEIELQIDGLGSAFLSISE